MGYPIVNSVEGPLARITKENLTEGCITRCILSYGNDVSSNSTFICIITYVLMLNEKLYLIDSHAQMVSSNFSGEITSAFIMPRKDNDDDGFTATDKLFPNSIQ